MWKVRIVRNFLVEWAVPALVAITIYSVMYFAMCGAGERIAQVAHDVHTIAESIRSTENAD